MPCTYSTTRSSCSGAAPSIHATHLPNRRCRHSVQCIAGPLSRPRALSPLLQHRHSIAAASSVTMLQQRRRPSRSHPCILGVCQRLSRLCWVFERACPWRRIRFRPQSARGDMERRRETADVHCQPVVTVRSIALFECASDENNYHSKKYNFIIYRDRGEHRRTSYRSKTSETTLYMISTS